MKNELQHSAYEKDSESHTKIIMDSISSSSIVEVHFNCLVVAHLHCILKFISNKNLSSEILNFFQINPISCSRKPA